MSYATLAELLVYLEQDDDSNQADLEEEQARVHSELNQELGFTFRKTDTTTTKTRKLDSFGDDELYLPAPGASSITSVVEDGVTLTTDQYELDPERGHFLLRLEDGEVVAWQEGRRIVTVEYLPAEAPRALVRAECVEVVRNWRAKLGGFSDTIGVAGTNEVTYTRAFAASTKRLLETLKTIHGRSGGMAGA